MNNLDIHTPLLAIETFLSGKGWISEEERVEHIEKPGEGNMNVVLRIQTNVRSFILKQSRPYVQKYQQIAAPLERIGVEHEFYRTLEDARLSNHFPAILNYDAQDHILQLQDLGQCDDMSYVYEKGTIATGTLVKLVAILIEIHQSDAPQNFPDNAVLRQLNHQHIFVLPFFMDNGFELDTVQEGLQALSLPYKKDWALAAQVTEIGKRYLSKGSVLLHGDYYPGSWMTQKDQLYVLDPEFSFLGFAEFDVGVLAAHCILASMKEEYLDMVLDHYPKTIDRTLTAQIAGIEIMRRLIGLAQLPLNRTIEEKQYLLQKAHQMILG